MPAVALLAEAHSSGDNLAGNGRRGVPSERVPARQARAELSSPAGCAASFRNCCVARPSPSVSSTPALIDGRCVPAFTAAPPRATKHARAGWSASHRNRRVAQLPVAGRMSYISCRWALLGQRTHPPRRHLPDYWPRSLPLTRAAIDRRQHNPQPEGCMLGQGGWLYRLSARPESCRPTSGGCRNGVADSQRCTWWL
jgi:hypothetical protein